MMPEAPPILYLTFLFILIVPFIAMYFFLHKRDKDEAARRTAWKDDLRKERTLRLVAEEDLKVRESSYAHLLNSTSDMVLVYAITKDGLPGRFTEVNEPACRKLGYSYEQLLTMTALDLEEVQPSDAMWGFANREPVTLSDTEIHDRQNAFARVLINQILEKKETVLERTFIASTGRRIPVEIHARSVDMRGQPLITYTIQDITERKTAEEALHDSERRFQDFFERSPIGVATYDGDRTLTNVNPACLRMLGIPDRQEFAHLNPFDNPFMPDSARKALVRGDTAHYEIELDFSQIRNQRMFVSARQGKGFFEILINHLVRDRELRAKGYLVQIIDVSRHREAEQALRDIERQLHQSQKMEALGTLAGGIAHDFNNILTPIIGYAEMALHIVPESEGLHQYMKEVVKASHRAKDLVNQILAFSRQATPEGRPIHITSIVKEVAKLLKAAAQENVDIQVVIKTEHDVVIADPTQIHQVLMNLCTNACHAMRENGGILELRLTDFMHSGRPKSDLGPLPPGRCLRLSVRDSGHGIDPSIMERIFEPFFTTKQKGEGTGMGLAVVHGIVSSLHGNISLQSEVGKGTTFHVVLPSVDLPEIDVSESVRALPTGRGRVLFVDDDPEIVKMSEEMLKTLGYEPVVAHQGVAALRIFTFEPEHFDAVVTDMVMPGLGGMDLAAEIHRVRPDLPIILCTGFSEIPSDQEMRSLGICGLLMKPIVMRDMAERLQQAVTGE